jgi:glutamate 5-kinase
MGAACGGYPAVVEQDGDMMNRTKLKESKRIVVKVGTSSLTYPNGRPDLQNIERLCRAISDLMNQGYEIILVSSGAIGIGMGKLRLKVKPQTIREKQAIASVGQCELMNLYSRFFSDYSYAVGQILLTRDDIDDGHTRENIINTFECLLEKEILPIVNENDTVSTREIYHNGTFGDNDSLSAIVSAMIGADLLILLSDISGLYDCDPKISDAAQLIDTVTEITPEIRNFAGGSGSSRGTGGMVTKLEAARIATEAGVHMVIANAKDPSVIKSILAGEKVGTMFVAKA